MSPTIIVGYLALFTLVGFVFLFSNLVIGWLLRPRSPNFEKLEIYECGEPTIGSSFVQFDLRFYVVALLFIIFDVEVAFFFPWAVVFGKATQLMDPNVAMTTSVEIDGKTVTDISGPAANVLSNLGVPNPGLPTTGLETLGADQQIRATAQSLAAMSIGDILVFFAVLMVGFAYVWRRGDLDWVRAVSAERAVSPGPELLVERDTALVG
jgi:NADH-quinone oxidoreductase subunit A